MSYQSSVETVGSYTLVEFAYAGAWQAGIFDAILMSVLLTFYANCKFRRRILFIRISHNGS